MRLFTYLFLIVSFSLCAQEKIVFSESSENAFPLVSEDSQAALVMDSSDFDGVRIAAKNFQKDIERVTGKLPELLTSEGGKNSVLIGTIGNSKVIDNLIDSGKLDVSAVKGKWEAYIIQQIGKNLVIAGSDKRGTIYGIYELSERIGVSPWYWWADVPVKKSAALYIKPGNFVNSGPKVQYRGIFINDEAPALSGWVAENFGDFNHKFYEHVFELILRLKGNYLWPAMWGRAFYDDDPQNPILADQYGVVIGTSHHEPLMRAHDEWRRYGEGDWNYDTNPENLQKFWRKGMERMGDNESLVTVGMRGDGDKPMTQGTAIELLEKIVADQRDIIADVTGKPASETPQVWALYKEVQDYYDQGMRVPDDVTLLLADDNWGNIRKLPAPDAKPRKGGYGIYYHFDYVGGPRNYKWINTNQISRVWEQMHLAYEFGAKKLWIVNVGDIKPMEFPISFFLDYAWNPEKIKVNDLKDYTVNWAKKNFPKEYAEETADLLLKYTKYNSRRKPELLSPETYSLTNFNEAESVLKDFSDLEEKAEKIYNQLPQEYHDAFYQLVLFPIKASANLNRLYIAAAKNKLYAEQGRASANKYADKVQEYFQKDKELTDYYHHKMANGKWNHMMSQTHIGYTYWQEPKENKAPEVTKIDLPEKAEMGIAVEGSKQAFSNSGNISLPSFDPYNDQQHYFDIFNKGKTAFKYEIKTDEKWVKVSSKEGKVDDEKRIEVSIDWKKAPAAASTASIRVKGADKTISIEVPVVRATANKVEGYVQNNKYISIPATGFTEKSDGANAWMEIPNLGKTGSSMTSDAIPAGKDFSEGNPSLTYDFYTFDKGSANLEFVVSPTIDFMDRGGLRFAYSVNGSAPKILNIQKDTEDPWGTSVANNATSVKANIDIEDKGAQKLKIWAVDPGIVIQKIIINFGKSVETYLGAPSSAQADSK